MEATGSVPTEATGSVPVLLGELSKKDRRSIIYCSVFLKEKYKADGSFDEVKARLVAGGHQQVRTVYGCLLYTSPSPRD